MASSSSSSLTSWESLFVFEHKHCASLKRQEEQPNHDSDNKKTTVSDQMLKQQQEKDETSASPIIGWTINELEPYRLMGDVPMDELLDVMAQEENVHLFHGTSSNVIEKSKKEFLKKMTTLPSWVDVQQLKRGQDVFCKFMPAIGASLYYQSLIPGFSIPQLVAVIQSTAYLTPPSSPMDVTLRLIDTSGFVLACMGGSIKTTDKNNNSNNNNKMDNNTTGILPGQLGWKLILHVRLLHAKVRRSLLKLHEKKTKDNNALPPWNITKFGIPINQEDMSATLLAFSLISLYGIEFCAGFKISHQEQEDYMALWRYIGWVLGVATNDDDDICRPHPQAMSLFKQQQQQDLEPLDPCGPYKSDHESSSSRSTIDRASILFQSIMNHLLEPDETSVIVAHHLLKIGLGRRFQKQQQHVSDDSFGFLFHALVCRQFAGSEIANALKLPQPQNMWNYIKFHGLVFLYLWLLRFYTWAMFVPFIKDCLYHQHAMILTKGFPIWLDRHSQRMQQASQTKGKENNLGSGQQLSPHENDTQDGGGKNDENQQSFGCPFAMVKPPIHCGQPQ